MAGWPGEPRMDYDVLMAGGPASDSAGAPITDVMFDFGNVLVRWDPAAVLVSRYSEDTARRFLDDSVSGFYAANDLMDAGASIRDGVEFVARGHGEPWASMMRFYLENFEDSVLGVVPGARVLIDDLRRAGIGVWGLSNWQRDLYAATERRYDVLRRLDGVVVSGYVGLRKPDAAIFELALRRFGIDRATTLFVDDKAMNVQGANRVGIRAVRFSDPRRLRGLLITAGVPIDPLV